MISARYRSIGVKLEAFQQTIPKYAEQLGWTTKKTIPGQTSLMLELKKGLFDKAVIKVRGVPDDLYVEVDGPQVLMDYIEQALAESSTNPAALIGWKEQAKQQAMDFAKSFAGVIQPPSGTMPLPPPVVTKPVAPKLEA